MSFFFVPLRNNSAKRKNRYEQADGYTIKSGPRTTGDGYYESVIALWDGIEIEITI